LNIASTGLINQVVKANDGYFFGYGMRFAFGVAVDDFCCAVAVEKMPYRAAGF
jgi:hypothetical protein